MTADEVSWWGRVTEEAVIVAQEVADVASELEQLKRRFEEFRSSRTSQGRLPQRLWEEAGEAAHQD